MDERELNRTSWKCYTDWRGRNSRKRSEYASAKTPAPVTESDSDYRRRISLKLARPDFPMVIGNKVQGIKGDEVCGIG